MLRALGLQVLVSRKEEDSLDFRGSRTCLLPLLSARGSRQKPSVTRNPSLS